MNSGYDEVKGQILANDLLKENNTWDGIDVDSGEITNFRERCVIDPTKVTRLALLNAASVAGTVLLTECTLSQDKKSIEEKLKIAGDVQNGSLMQ